MTTLLGCDGCDRCNGCNGCDGCARCDGCDRCDRCGCNRAYGAIARVKSGQVQCDDARRRRTIAHEIAERCEFLLKDVARHRAAMLRSEILQPAAEDMGGESEVIETGE